MAGLLLWLLKSVLLKASFLADTSLRKLCTAIFKVVWCRRQPLANVGAVHGPQGCGPAYCVIWFRFRGVRKGFRGGPGLDIHGILQLFNSDHVRERDKALLGFVLVGGVWNRFQLGKVRGQHVPCRFCGGVDSDGHLFWDSTFPPLVEICEHPEFHGLMEMDKYHWPRCLLWHGWLPLLSGANGSSPWTEDP